MEHKPFHKLHGNSLARTLVTLMSGLALLGILAWSSPGLRTAFANGQASYYV